jgi:hypothetical protein
MGSMRAFWQHESAHTTKTPLAMVFTESNTDDPGWSTPKMIGSQGPRYM